MIEPLFTSLPPDFAAWHPAGQATVLFVATFILEDAAALGAGLLLGAEGIGWSVAFWSCFLGIWIGDAGLYALARWLGRPWFERSRFARHAGAVSRSEAWFQRRGMGLLVFSRMLPGARLPTYLSAGFLRLPFGRFLLITGLAALAWTGLVLALSRSLGGWLRRYFELTAGGMLWILAGIVVALVVVGMGRHPAWREWVARFSLPVRRLTRWEFWPAWLFYPPVALHCLWLGIKYRGLTLPSAANPGIFTGGLVGESKMAMLSQLMATSPEDTVVTVLIPQGTGAERLRTLKDRCAENQIGLPFVLKPDLGQRGAGVKLIRTWDQAGSYLTDNPVPVLAQRYAPGPCEIGVFYHRFPGDEQGRIFSITQKVFPEVVGDGVSTLTGLIDRDPRARLLRDRYLKRFRGEGNRIPASGERVRLVEAGNHAQGCVFKDGSHLITPSLERKIDEIARRLDGFHIGRFDIRYESVDGKVPVDRFDIVELNGAAAESTNIYDSRFSLRHAYRILFRQWELVYAIGAANRSGGHAPDSLGVVLREWLRYRKLSATYPIAD